MDIGIHKSKMSMSDMLKLMKKKFVYFLGLLPLAYTKITIVLAIIPIINKRPYITEKKQDEKLEWLVMFN